MMNSVICDSFNCPFLETDCGNRGYPFREQWITNCVPRTSKKVGKQLIAMGDIPSGQVLGQYVGYVVLPSSENEGNYVAEVIGRDITGAIQPNKILAYINAEFHGNLTRYISHSCIPNCTMRQLRVPVYGRDKKRIGNKE